jgi:predicted ABC-type ATPase
MFARWLERLRRTGYRSHLVFLSLPSPEMSLARVAERVRAGGHDVPAEVVRRRFVSGLRNLFGPYADRLDSWEVLDNSGLGELVLVAERDAGGLRIHDHSTWHRLSAWTT